MFSTISFPEGKDTQFEMFRYPGGEVQVRLTPKQIEVLRSVQQVHVVARIKDGEIMAVAQLLDAIKSVVPHDIKLILPYLPYGRADRRFVDGDCGGLQTFGRILNTFAGVEIVTLDVHSGQAAKYIRHFTDVSPKPIIDTVALSIPGRLGVLLPDAGAARYGIKTHLQATKVRDPETGKLNGFVVPGKSQFDQLDSVLIIDDICDGGGTFLGIADQMKDYGLDLYLYVTHGIFSKGLTDLFKRFKKIYTTDSFGTAIHAASEDSDRLITIPCMGTILDKIVDRPALYENAAEQEIFQCGTARAAKAVNEAILKYAIK